MAFRFEPGEAPGPGVRRVTLELVERTEALLAGETEVGTDEAIHSARKSFKRLRALLRLARGPLGRATWKGEDVVLRDCGRLLAGARDAAVLVATLDGLAPDLDVSLPAFTRLRAGLAAGHQARRDRVVERTGAHRQVANELALLAARVPRWRLDDTAPGDLVEGFVRVYAKGREAMAHADEERTPEVLHEWRKLVKQHWHHVELYEAADPDVLRQRARDAHRLSDFLGDDHDLHVLATTALGEPARYGPADDLAGLVAVVDDRRRALTAAALALGGELYAEDQVDLAARLAPRLTGLSEEAPVALP